MILMRRESCFSSARCSSCSIPVTAPMVLAVEKFSAAMKASPRVTRVVDYLFAGAFSAFALKILTAQAK